MLVVDCFFPFVCLLPKRTAYTALVCSSYWPGAKQTTPNRTVLCFRPHHYQLFLPFATFRATNFGRNTSMHVEH